LLRAAIGNGTAFDAATAFFFNNTDCMQRSLFLQGGESGGVLSLKNAQIVELGKLFERSVDGNLAVFLYTGL
jgi:hypothetical protein